MENIEEILEEMAQWAADIEEQERENAEEAYSVYKSLMENAQ